MPFNFSVRDESKLIADIRMIEISENSEMIWEILLFY
jgi:hypothetical protein